MERRIRRGVLTGAGLLLVAGLIGCGDEPRGTGLRKVLYLHGSYEAVASGLEARVEVPGSRYFPEGAHPPDVLDGDHWDFKDATLEVDAPEGLAFEVLPPTGDPTFFTRHATNQGFILSASCDAAPGVPHEVRLRVRGPEGVRYEDAFQVTCHRASRMEARQWDEASYQWVPMVPGRTMVGGRLRAKLLLFADTAGGAVPLSGNSAGEAPTLRQDILRIDASSSRGWTHGSFDATFEATAPGAGPELVFRDVSLAMPLESVTDEAWRLVQAPPESSGDIIKRWRFQAHARDAEGSTLLGLHDCSWRFDWASGVTYEERGCDLSLGENLPRRACVTALGKTDCRDFP